MAWEFFKVYCRLGRQDTYPRRPSLFPESLGGRIREAQRGKTAADLRSIIYVISLKAQTWPFAFCSLNAKQIDDFYLYHIDFSPEDPELEAVRFRRLLDEAVRLLGDGKHPQLRVHTALHSLLLLDALLDDFAGDWGRHFASALDRFVENLAKATKNKEQRNEYWTRYGAYARTASMDKGVLQGRHDFFVRKMLDMMSPLTRKDPNRSFSTQERELLYFSRDKNCAICGKMVDWHDAEAHHIKPHALGGITTLENAALVHIACHPKGGRALDPEILGRVTATIPPWESDDEENSRNQQQKKGSRKHHGVKMADLHSQGLLEDGQKFVYSGRKKSVHAVFKAPETIIYELNGQEKETKSPSTALSELVGNSRDGWLGWKVLEEDGHLVGLDDLRKLFLEGKADSGDEEGIEDDEETDEGEEL